MTVQPGSRIVTRAQLRAVPNRAPSPPPLPKYAPPRFPPDLVGLERHRHWLGRLAQHELALLQAPPGYGKTAWCAALFAQARDAGWRTAWLSFDGDEAGSDAIDHVCEALGAADLTAEPAATRAAALAERIDADDRLLLLILDDVDRLGDAVALDLLDRLLRRPPVQLRLVLSGRAAPSVAIGDARRRGMMLSIGRAELALDDAETRDFLHAAGATIDAREATDLNRLVEGWPAAIRLLARQPSRLRAIANGGDRTAFARLVEEAVAPSIETLPAATQTFLRRCSVAARFDPDLCRLLSGDQNAASILSDLAARGIFLDPPRDGDRHYRLHPAAQAALRLRLDSAEPGTAAQLHRAAARHFAAQDCRDEAIEQALAAGDPEMAAEHIASAAMPMLEQGETAALAEWMRRLPPAMPGLARIDAWLSALSADPHAASAIARIEDEDAEEARAVALVHRAFAEDHFPDVVETCDQMLAAPEGLSEFAGAMVRAAFAHGALKRGLFGLVHDMARPLLLRGARRGLDLPVALAVCARAAVARAQGQLGEAERLLREAHRVALAPNLSPNLSNALLSASLARCCYERDDPDTAAALAAEALPLLEASAFQDALIHAFLVAIRVAAGRQENDRAASLIDRAELLAFERGWAPLKALCIVERARLRLPQTIDAETVVAVADEEEAVRDPLSSAGRAFALLSEMRAYEAIANGDRPRLTAVAERLLQLGSAADDSELRTSATLFNILPQLSGRCDKMVELETVRFLNHAASVGFRRTIVDVLDVTGVRAVQNFCSEAYSSGSFLALLKLAEPARRNPALEGGHAAAPGEAFSFLTEREIEILSALNAGESNKEIARTLQLAPETVKWHLKNVMRKLRAGSREEAVSNAATLGLKLIDGPTPR